mmetsp:Transcript_20111/g.43469  ORF Transcript_20111/g.43469 Transcript_20111/m.43469 type:complete len:368 (+) Transcript_20111:1830-2933(+)
MAKSELLTASMPSFPMMPTPMWPALIMATSLAPSPIARQHDPGTPNLIMLSICAFWSLRARQATTERQTLATSVNTGLHSVPKYSIAFSSKMRHTSRKGDVTDAMRSGLRSCFPSAPASTSAALRPSAPAMPLASSAALNLSTSFSMCAVSTSRARFSCGCFVSSSLVCRATSLSNAASSSLSAVSRSDCRPLRRLYRRIGVLSATMCAPLLAVDTATPWPSLKYPISLEIHPLSRSAAAARKESSFCCTASISAVDSSLSTGNESHVNSIISASNGRMLHARAMFIAVPTLSPVSIHTLIPAVRKSRKISGTPSCSLSSIAEAPCSTRSDSICRCRSVILLGLPSLRFCCSSGDAFAVAYSTAHAS